MIGALSVGRDDLGRLQQGKNLINTASSKMTTTIETTRARLFEKLAELGIDVTTVPYPAHETVEEGKARRGDMPGQFTKNLLLRDKKGALFLVVAAEDQPIDLKTLHRRVGARGQLSFARPEQMRSSLNIEPGALTPLALISDRDGQVRMVIDASLLDADQLNFHPLINTESAGIRPEDLLTFIRACGHEPMLVSFDASTESGPSSSSE